MSIVLDKWQEEVLEHKGDLLLCTGRRVGKTYIMARKAVERMVKEKTPIVIVSLTEDQALIIHFMALNYIKDTYPHLLITKGEGKPTQRFISLKNGSTMMTRPVGNTGDGARGFEGGVLIVDEASRMPKIFWIAAKPILLTTNGEIWMCSTPHGKQGYFWTSFNDSWNKKLPDARFKSFYITSPEVMKNRPLSEEWTEEKRLGAERILKEEMREMSEMEFGQEYLGLFLEELMGFFEEEDVEKAMQLERGYVRGNLFLGVDVARMGRDSSTFEIFQERNGHVYQVENIITKKTRLTDTANMIIDLDRKYNFERKGIGLDDAGLGAGVFDILFKVDSVKRKIVGLNNASRPVERGTEEKDGKTTRLLKEEMYIYFKSLMERGLLHLLNDNNIRDSLMSVQYEYINGKMRIFGLDTHIPEGMIRATYCAKNKGLNIYLK